MRSHHFVNKSWHCIKNICISIMKDIKSAFIPFMIREVSGGHRSSQLAVAEVKQYLSTDVNMMGNGQY